MKWIEVEKDFYLMIQEEAVEVPFERKFTKFRTNGDLNQVQLYARI